jgi:pyruvate,orthophosphate dikinase
MGKTCVVGACAIDVDYKTQRFSVNGRVVKRGDYISLDGSLGEVILGRVPTIEPSLSGDFATLMEWADEVKRLKVRANADTPEDARKAREFSAAGIGLCRTEHMFFGENRIDYVRQMILVAADAKNLRIKLQSLHNELEKAPRDKKAAVKKEIVKTKEELKQPQALYTKALNALLPMQRGDFEKIFAVMDGLPVTIRLLDPPLHEFLPQDEASQTLVSKKMKVSLKDIKRAVARLHEFNPMLGHRGCRLGVTYKEIYDMQVRAIVEAACNVKKKGMEVIPEIMIPIVGTEQELKIFRDNIIALAGEIIKKKGVEIKYTVGTMIELPRAAVTADRIARQADFFSFGTNDLTQMTFGFSRDDIGNFLPEYIERGILDKDPFQSLDQEGVGMLIEIGVKKGRSTKPNLKIGICGEHGGDPSSIAFCHRVGMDYVSCSPFRVPIARLAAAQVNITGVKAASTV